MGVIKTSFILPRDLWKNAKIRAAEQGISLGELVRKAIEDYLSKTESKKGKK
jgi:predicted HicB family RNase H-like nuclease